MIFGPPVDFADKDLTCVTDALSKVPRPGVLPLRKDAENKYLSRALRLNNNHIFDLSGLDDVLSTFLSKPSKLGWLDLSFNKITAISSVLCQLKELRILYLHGNSIINLTEVDKLGKLVHLHTITLHGNSIEFTNRYRSHVISVLPRLKKMDFSLVTPRERSLTRFGQKS